MFKLYIQIIFSFSEVYLHVSLCLVTFLVPDFMELQQKMNYGTEFLRDLLAPKVVTGSLDYHVQRNCEFDVILLAN